MSNIYLSAADGNLPAILAHLSTDATLLHAHDPNGYTVLHALASYNHLDILTTLVKDHGGNINIEDFEGDTPLYVVETVLAAKTVIDLGGDVYHVNHEGQTAADFIESDGDYPLVGAYLRSLMDPTLNPSSNANGTTVANPSEDVSISVSAAQDVAEMLAPVDETLKRKIEELAGRADFDSADAQGELRNLVREAVQKHVLGGEEEERNVRARE